MGTRGQMFWLQPGLAASLHPGARPRTTLSPSMALRDGTPWMSFGTPGGDQQDQWQTIFFLRMLHHNLNIQEAIDLPSFHSEHFTFQLLAARGAAGQARDRGPFRRRRPGRAARPRPSRGEGRGLVGGQVVGGADRGRAVARRGQPARHAGLRGRPLMRRLLQPGPAPVERIESLAGPGVLLGYTLEPGRSLVEALTAPLVAAGLRSAAIVFGAAALAPFRFVLPGPARDGAHVAWFSDPHAPGGDPTRPTVVETANADLRLACRRALRALPRRLGRAGRDAARRSHAARRNLSCRPSPRPCLGAGGRRDHRRSRSGDEFPAVPSAGGAGGAPRAGGFVPDGAIRLIAARVRPNEDVGAALVALCARYGLARAAVRGSLGSLIGAGFADGRVVPDLATEVLVRYGTVAPGADGALAATLDLVVVDALGRPHEGRLAPGENPVCITFEVMLEAV